MKPFLICLSLLLATKALFADDWTLTNGTVYKNVKVLSHDSAFVTILDSEGGGRVPLRLLPAALQTQFGYNAFVAQMAEAAAKAADVQSAKEVAAEAEAHSNAARTEPPSRAVPAVSPDEVGIGALAAPPKLTDTEKQDLLNQLSELWRQLNQARQTATKADAASTSDFERHTYSNSTGQTEHRYTKGASQDGVDNHAAIAQLEAQIDVLEGKLHGAFVATPPPESIATGANGSSDHHTMSDLGQ